MALILLVGFHDNFQIKSEGREEVIVCRLRSSSMMSVEVVIGGLSLKAIIVDTAAKVTLISDKVYTSLTPQPPKLQEV